MPAVELQTAQRTYSCVIERGILQHACDFIPTTAGKLFIVTTKEVWHLHGAQIKQQFRRAYEVLLFEGGEVNKRLAAVEDLAEQMVRHGADRSSVVIGFGGGIVTDVSGFLAAIFMRGISVLQIPTTLLAQVDAALGGKTGVNLKSGKNLMGSFHQPIAVLIDPDVLSTLPDREYRAGLFEVIKCGVIRDPALFELLANHTNDVLSQKPDVVDELIGRSVRIKAEVVSEDEREHDLRRILNFGHTIGHAIEAETGYTRFLHGEAVAWGMLAATGLAELLGMLDTGDGERIRSVIFRYGPPPATDLDAGRLMRRLAGDKKALQGKVHFVLPTAIGEVKIVSGIEPCLIQQAILESLHESQVNTATGTHPPGTSNEREAAEWVQRMFANIAPRYDCVNHLLSFNIDRSWRTALTNRLSSVLKDPGAKVLDLCCGTGDVLLDFQRLAQSPVLGADFCHPMLVTAQRKAAQQGFLARLFEADALQLPIADHALDAISIAFGFRNLTNYYAGLCEFRRVLRPGGMLAILEFSHPPGAFVKTAYRFYSRVLLPVIGSFLSRTPGAYVYLPESIQRFPSAKQLESMMRQAGFVNTSFELLTGGIAALHTGLAAGSA